LAERRGNNLKRRGNNLKRFNVSGVVFRVKGSASERRGDTLKRFEGFHLKARTRFWSCLPCVCHIPSTAGGPRGRRGGCAARRSYTYILYLYTFYIYINIYIYIYKYIYGVWTARRERRVCCAPFFAPTSAMFPLRRCLPPFQTAKCHPPFQTAKFYVLACLTTLVKQCVHT